MRCSLPAPDQRQPRALPGKSTILPCPIDTLQAGIVLGLASGKRGSELRSVRCEGSTVNRMQAVESLMRGRLATKMTVLAGNRKPCVRPPTLPALENC